MAFTFMLGACVTPALLLSPQSQLMWALLKPMVGLDPNEMNLLEQPLIKNRMQPLLGEHYDTAVTLLKTADKVQQEGPLFYLVSNHTPIPQMAEKAGFVWNSETNQMAVMLVSGGAPLVFAEQLNNQAAKVVPSWPADLADYTDPVKLKQKALQKATSEASGQLGLDSSQQNLATAVLGGAKVEDLAKTKIEKQKQQLVETATAPVSAEIKGAQTHISAVKTQVKTATDIKAQAQDAVAQAADVKAQTKALSQPVVDAKAQAQDAVAQAIDVKLQTQALSQPVVDAKVQTTTAVLAAAEDDLAAEMAAEQAQLSQNSQQQTKVQQTIVQQKAAQLQAAKAAVVKAQADVTAAATLLAKANSPAEFAAAKQQLDAASQTLEQARQLEQKLTEK
jgi:chemotaxis protein histidine kinase CheA